MELCPAASRGLRAGVNLEKQSGWERRLPWNRAAFHETIIQGLKRRVNRLSRVRDWVERGCRYQKIREVACFRGMRGGAIVHFVRARGALRARLVAAILSLALIYAFTCSATCANCLDASGAAQTRSQACGHATSDAGGGTQQHAPAKPDCFGHHRFGFEVMRSDGLSQFQLSASDYESVLIVGAFRAEIVNVASPFLWDLAPPRTVAILPLQRISILRI